MANTTNDKRMLDREALRSVIQQWNANRLDLFELSEPNENLEFHGVMRFYFQDTGQKVATKCIRVASDATVADVIQTLIEKFRPDMRMLSVPNYAIYEVHSNGEERKLNGDEKPLLVQLNWHVDDREGRFLLRNLDAPKVEATEVAGFKRKLSKREKKEQKKKEKLGKLQSDGTQVAEKLYTELPETSFTRSISNPEAVMRRRRQQKLERKLQQFRSKDGGPDTGGTLKIYGETLDSKVPYKTLLLSIRDCAQAVVREMLMKYGQEKVDPQHYCLVQVNSDGSEYILDDDECPLSILMNYPTSRGSIMFHVRRRPADSQQRRRKKKPSGLSNGSSSLSGTEREGPCLIEVTHSGDGGRRVKLTSEPLEVGSANTNALQIFGPSIQARHCLISLCEGVCTVTPLHPDALTFVNGHHITQPTVLHNGSVVMFGRGASYRFLDTPSIVPQLTLSQSQLDSAYLYESRSPTTPTWHEDDSQSMPAPRAASSYLDTNGGDTSSHIMDQSSVISMKSSGGHHDRVHSLNSTNPLNNNINNNDTDSVNGPNDKSEMEAAQIENDAKSISSNKSVGSTQDRSRIAEPTHGQEHILPAVLEFPELHQEAFLRGVITELDVNAPIFKLAPVYTLYLCARYRASTHYRPELQPTERAHKLTIFLHQVANMIYNVVVEQHNDPKILSFWIANASEFLHFLKSDRHISAFSVQAQEVLAESVQIAFRNLVQIFQVELSQTLSQFLSENIDHDSAAGLVLSVLGSAMALLRECRVNAALTIQLFSQLFHYINVVCFNKFVSTSHMCTSAWGKALTERLSLLEVWAEKQGLELAADCHLAKINQCAQFLQAPKTSEAEVKQLACTCFRLNSRQMAALLSQETIPRNLIDTAILMAESVADELTRADGREIVLEESTELPLALLLPDDGFSCDVVRNIPAALIDFIAPLQAQGMCRLAAQPTSIGLWTVYMHQFNLTQGRSPSVMSSKLPQPQVQTIKLHKNSSGMGLSIVAAKGAGQERLGIYIKSVVPGGAADIDGRLQAGDQLLTVDGQSLIGITQERAADYLVRTGPVVTLEVAKQGAIYHGLATLLQQPSPLTQRGGRKMTSDFEINRSMGGDSSKPPLPNQLLTNSKSVPTLHHQSGNTIAANAAANKSRSINNLIGSHNATSSMHGATGMVPTTNGSEQGFYQNVSVYRGQQHNQSHPNLQQQQQQERSPPQPHNQLLLQQQAQLQNRPSSAYYNNNLGQTSPGYVLNQTAPAAMNATFSHPNLAQSVAQQQQQQQQRNRSFAREAQGQQSLRSTGINQMMAPSMPNIAHSSGYASNIQASQSMQNVNAIPPQAFQNGGGAGYAAQGYNMPSDHPHHQRPPMMQNFAPRGSSLKGQEMINEMMSRRSQPTAHSSMEHISGYPGYQQQQQGQQNLQPHPSPQRQQNFAFPPNRTMSPMKQLPPTAPKPNRHMEETILTPPLPPTSTHPLYSKQPTTTSSAQQNSNYVASLNEPPKMALYPNNANTNTTKHVTASSANPWEREEREKEHEIRRDHARVWRDQLITDLSGLQSRSQQQEEQLKALLMEREFERRALEEDAEEESDAGFQKENIQEVVRLTSQPNSGGPLKTVNIRSPSAMGSAMTTAIDSPRTAASPIPPSTSAVQPKSILKHNSAASNPSSPSKAKTPHYIEKGQNLTELTINNTNANQYLTQMSKNLAQLSMSDELENVDDAKVSPPPPPERNSSYLIMAQQQQKLIKSNVNNNSNNNNTIPRQNVAFSTSYTSNIKNNNVTSPMTTSGPLSPNANTEATFTGASTSQTATYLYKNDNKRVSFHDEENNVIPITPTSPNNNSDPGVSGIGQAELAIIREDPNKFIEETEAMLESPTSPDAGTEQWNMHIQSTPGVIGAQEVYRDPRTRRLAEQQKNLQKNTEAVPEKLSFKEKMKMFALETGEAQTPKDKLKISRAQRDIDAVH